jgi:cyclic-di-GMP phosphodiesterase, flagellum assembly factor TipF
MVRIGAIFVAVCMVLIAGSLGALLYLRFGFSVVEAAVVALGLLTALAVYNAVAGRGRDRAEVGDQVANLARGTGDLARQLAEFGRRLSAMETKVETVLDKALSTAQPLAIEIEELSRLVKQLADTLAEHEVAIGEVRRQGVTAPAVAAERPAAEPALAVLAAAPPSAPAMPPPPAAAGAAAAESPARAEPAPAAAPVAPPAPQIAAFSGLDRDGIIAAIGGAIEAHRIELYLQPVVTLPQRKVRYYEALARLKLPNGDPVAAADFLAFAEAGSLLPKLDSLMVLRCMQVVRRLSLKNRDVGVFCNLSGSTLTDSGFPQLLEFAEANRAIAPSLVFEFSQSAVRAMGPIEHESLAALAERGFRFSMDNLADLRVEPRELNERGFRFIKAPASLLLNRIGGASTDIHPADFSDLLGRFGIDLIADRIESEMTVVDLLDYDVRFGQGFLFSPPRPVRAEALQSLAGQNGKADAARAAPQPVPAAPADIAGGAHGGAAQLARAGGGRN